MSGKRNTQSMLRYRVGELPLLQKVSEQLGLETLLGRYLPSHGNEKVPAAESLLLLIYNITSGRQPLYELPRWTVQYDGRLFGRNCQLSETLFNDDRYGRALDKLHEADRASLMTELVLRLIQVSKLDLSQIHNDSTSVKTTGQMPGVSRDGLRFARGHSKDHRPDLKQIVFSLTLSSDGAVPIHFKTYSGNRTDDTTHINTWSAVRKLAGKPDFLYVADCKVCTRHQLGYITRHGGRVVTLLPETWGEAKQFKEKLRETLIPKRRILRKRVPNSLKPKLFESFYCFVGNYTTEKDGYTLHWIYTTEKRKRDRLQREERLLRVEGKLTELMGKLNTAKLKTPEQIRERVETLLNKHSAADFYHITINSVQEISTRQIGKGRPGKNTRYKTTQSTIYTLSWGRDRQALQHERRIDGIFPLLSTDASLSAKEALLAYKFQPRLEKRFQQLKSVHQIAPTLCKKVERVEALMFLYFVALIIQALIERAVRHSMEENTIEAIPIYPEHRLAYHPTTAKIVDRFQEVSVCRLMEGKKMVNEFHDPLDPTQLSVLTLLGMSEKEYWQHVH
jgi:transposase